MDERNGKGDRSESERGERTARQSITVGILGGDPVVYGALEQLLRGSGYRTKLLAASRAGEEPVRSHHHHLLLLMPGLKHELREAALADPAAGAAPTTCRAPVLELVAALGRGDGGEQDGRSVPWPCRAAELERRIEAALAGTRDDP